jgi:hypothetical protein
MKTDLWYSNPTQVYWACKNLVDGRTILTKTGFREVKGWRLGDIVHSLLKKSGWPILAVSQGPQNVAHNNLAPRTDRASLRFPPSAKRLSEQGKGRLKRLQILRMRFAYCLTEAQANISAVLILGAMT